MCIYKFRESTEQTQWIQTQLLVATAGKAVLWKTGTTKNTPLADFCSKISGQLPKTRIVFPEENLCTPPSPVSTPMPEKGAATQFSGGRGILFQESFLQFFIGSLQTHLMMDTWRYAGICSCQLNSHGYGVSVGGRSNGVSIGGRSRNLPTFLILNQNIYYFIIRISTTFHSW